LQFENISRKPILQTRPFGLWTRAAWS